ncbi:MAG: PilZ domain-containing protein [Verrucomicrobiota bacterium]
MRNCIVNEPENTTPSNAASEVEDRRRSIRFFVEGHVYLRQRSPGEPNSHTGLPANAYTLRNVSDKGLSLTITEQISPNSLVDIWLSPDKVDQDLPFTGKVKWCMPSGSIGHYLLGVEFLDPGGTNLNFFRRLLEDDGNDCVLGMSG